MGEIPFCLDTKAVLFKQILNKIIISVKECGFHTISFLLSFFSINFE